MGVSRGGCEIQAIRPKLNSNSTQQFLLFLFLFFLLIPFFHFRHVHFANVVWHTEHFCQASICEISPAKTKLNLTWFSQHCITICYPTPYIVIKSLVFVPIHCRTIPDHLKSDVHKSYRWFIYTLLKDQTMSTNDINTSHVWVSILQMIRRGFYWL